MRLILAFVLLFQFAKADIEVTTFAPRTGGFNVRVDLLPNRANSDVCIFAASLDTDWTPDHCSALSSWKTEGFWDEWEDMPPGRYRVWAELHRKIPFLLEQDIESKLTTVEVLP